MFCNSCFSTCSKCVIWFCNFFPIFSNEGKQTETSWIQVCFPAILSSLALLQIMKTLKLMSLHGGQYQTNLLDTMAICDLKMKCKPMQCYQLQQEGKMGTGGEGCEPSTTIFRSTIVLIVCQLLKPNLPFQAPINAPLGLCCKTSSLHICLLLFKIHLGKPRFSMVILTLYLILLLWYGLKW